MLTMNTRRQVNQPMLIPTGGQKCSMPTSRGSVGTTFRLWNIYIDYFHLAVVVWFFWWKDIHLGDFPVCSLGGIWRHSTICHLGMQRHSTGPDIVLVKNWVAEVTATHRCATASRTCVWWRLLEVNSHKSNGFNQKRESGGWSWFVFPGWLRFAGSGMREKSSLCRVTAMLGVVYTCETFSTLSCFMFFRSFSHAS